MLSPPPFLFISTQTFGVFDGPYDDFNTDWYGNMGVTFVLIVIVDNVTHNAVMVVKMLLKKLLVIVKRREVRDTLLVAAGYRVQNTSRDMPL